MNADILFEEIAVKKGQLGFITLNRPQALNALTHNMIQTLDKQLHAWSNNAKIFAVIIRSNSERAFCAGGDIRRIYEAGIAGDNTITRFFWDEYQLNRRIATYPKPYFALLDGITMGGGVGISIHSPYCIATERLIFAMPETSIGFFPDIGASYFLPRCRGKLGFYLGLTGGRIHLADALYAGLIKHSIASTQVGNFTKALTNIDWIDNPKQSIKNCITTFNIPTSESALAQQQTLIDECFSAPTMIEIMERLARENTAFADETLKLLNTKSPTSLAVTLRQLQQGATLNLEECLQMEYRMVNHFLKNHDLYTGVKAVIIDKTQNPQWNPDKLSAITETMIDSYFAPIDEKLLFT